MHLVNEVSVDLSSSKFNTFIQISGPEDSKSKYNWSGAPKAFDRPTMESKPGSKRLTLVAKQESRMCPRVVTFLRPQHQLVCCVHILSVLSCSILILSSFLLVPVRHWKVL